MTESLDPFGFLLNAVSGWMNQQQLQLIVTLQPRTCHAAVDCRPHLDTLPTLKDISG